MKVMKRFAGIVLALVMVLCLTAPALAAEKDIDLKSGDGVIKVTNPAPEQTYKLYKIFDLSYGAGENGANPAHTYTVNADWEEFFKQDGIVGTYVDIDPQGYVTWHTETVDNKEVPADVEAFAKAALLWAEGSEEIKNADGTVTPAVEGHITKPVAELTADTAADPTAENPDPRADAITFSGLELGYYLISSTRGTLCALDSTNKTADVTEKNVKPTVEKDAVKMPDGIGDTVEYEVVIHAKKGAEKYVLHDTMTTGLKFNGDVEVKVNNEVVPAGNYTVDTETTHCTFEVIFNQSYLNTLTADNTDIVVSYTATVTAAAVTVDSITNTATLTFNNESTPEETLPDPAVIPLYFFDLVKTNSDSIVINNAEFKLYDAEENGNEVALIWDAEANAYRPITDGETGGTIVAGNVRIKGLGEGIYWLEETKQPDGYNRLTNRQKVDLTKGNLEATVRENKYVANTTDDPATENVNEEFTNSGVQVINLTGAELPSTGGIGTTIFYIAGGALAVGAGILLVTKKRVGAKEEE